MNRMVVRSKVGSDGVLHLDLPLGPREANKDVQIVVEAVLPSEIRKALDTAAQATARNIANGTPSSMSSVQPATPGFWREIDAFRARLAASAREFGDSVREIREDRER